MIRTQLAIAALVCLPLRAQFDNLVTTDDGSILLFQSQWRLAGTNAGSLTKIYRWDSKGFTTVFLPPDTGLLSPPSASNPIISGDGTISGYMSYPGCSGAACNTAGFGLVLIGAAFPASLPPFATLQLSRNGRYLAADTTVLDRTTGSMTQAPAGSLVSGGRFGLGNNGALLYLVVHNIPKFSTVDLILSSHPSNVIANAQYVPAAVVSAAENRVVYEIPGGGNRQLWAYDVSTSAATKLEEFNFNSSVSASQFEPSISNDGSRMLYRRINPTTQDWEAVVHDFTANTTAVLGPMVPSNNNFTITGNGQAAWYHTAGGQLVRTPLGGSLAPTLTAGRHVWMSQREGAPSYGSYNHLFGGGFANTTGITVDIAGLNCPIISGAARELDIQIPWETYPGNFTLTLRNSASPFESVLPIQLVNLMPAFERSGSPLDTFRSLIIAHEDFHGLVTFADPIKPGETVHFYMTGLGDVQPRPLTGKPPTSITYASQRPVCLLTTLIPRSQTVAPVQYAGIAPTLIGIYQVDVTIPAGLTGSVATIECFVEAGAQGLTGDYATIFIGG